MKTIPAGIEWERTGPREHRVTIRSEPEVVYELTDYQQNLWANARTSILWTAKWQAR
jgi:hypothetical protein